MNNNQNIPPQNEKPSFASNYNFVRAEPPQTPPSPNTIIPEERKTRLLLLAACLGLGILCRVLFGFSSNKSSGMLMSIFWLGYSAIFIIFNREKLKESKLSWLLLGASTAICLWQIFYYAFYLRHISTYSGKANFFYFLNFLSIPAVLMLQAQMLCHRVSAEKKPNLLSAMIYGTFVQPFMSIPQYFKSYTAVKSERKVKNLGKILIGIVIGFPLLILVLYFLAKSDENFALLLDRTIFAFLRWISLTEIISTGIVVLLVSMLFFSFFWSTHFAPHNFALNKPTNKHNPISASTILIMLLIAYLLFAVVQFRYLFSSTLPEKFSYAEYARHGFGELIIVCLINIIILAIMLHIVRESKLFKTLSIGLMVANFVMFFSSSMRLVMYISAYGLTEMRTLAAWFIIYLAFASILWIRRVIKPDFAIFQSLYSSFIVWYVLLNFTYMFLPITT